MKKLLPEILPPPFAMEGRLYVQDDAAVKIAGTTGDTSQQAFAARKDSGLIADVNRALGELRAEGTLKQISEKYFGTDVSGP